jgi:hypothetical protein
VIDLHCPCDLHHDLVEKSILIGAFTRNPAQIDKNADMPPERCWGQTASAIIARDGQYPHAPSHSQPVVTCSGLPEPMPSALRG